jgi:hypothetical protein
VQPGAQLLAAGCAALRKGMGRQIAAREMVHLVWVAATFKVGRGCPDSRVVVLRWSLFEHVSAAFGNACGAHGSNAACHSCQPHVTS